MEWTEGEKEEAFNGTRCGCCSRRTLLSAPALIPPHTGSAALVCMTETIYEEFQQRGIVFSDTRGTHMDSREFALLLDINGYYIRVAEPVA